MSPPSWILQVRDKLTRSAGGDPHGEVDQIAFLPLYVDAGELWVLLGENLSAEIPDWGEAGFAGGRPLNGEHVWGTVERLVEAQIGTPPAQVLRLGELGSRPNSRGVRIAPCVGAIPRPHFELPHRRDDSELFSLPLSTLDAPRLVEERALSTPDGETWIHVYHVGRRRIAGVVAEILDDLIQRLIDPSSVP